MTEKNQQETGTRSSPWRQPVMWLVIGLPVAVVIAGIIMIILAGGQGATDVVPDDVQRTAQIQTADLGPDQTAHDMRLSAIARIDLEGGFVEVLPVNGDFDREAPLRLHLLHPALEDGDQSFEVQPTETGWRADGTPGVEHAWRVRLEPIDGQWRLHGRLPAGQQAVSLRPSMDLGAPDDAPRQPFANGRAQ